ncbi:unnamed protein product [Meloidogyne enterolobii]|uniref:Uncharacterized protein n=1 Tax=Meloidogyne enterolobii TaxID=390850 RepID=A0ACB1ATP3_MELEN
MDSNSDKLTQTNMTRNTSLTSIESGFVSLNEPKTKEAMTVDIDLICNKMEEKKKGKNVEICTKIGKILDLFKELAEKARLNVKVIFC